MPMSRNLRHFNEAEDLRSRLRNVLAARGRPTPRPAAARVWAFTGMLVALAVVVYVEGVRGLPAVPSPITIPWPVLAAAFVAAETKVILVHFRRETHSFSLSEIPAVLGLFFVTPDDYLLAVVAGSAVALLVATRQSVVKIAFNLANFAFISTVALVVFQGLGSFDGRPGTADWIAAFAAMLVACVLGAMTIATAISLSGGAPQFQKLPEMLKFGGMVALANTSLALLAISVIWITGFTSRSGFEVAIRSSTRRSSTTVG